MGRDRRAFLAAAGVGVAGVLAGCSGENDEMTTEEVNETLDGTETDTPTETETATPEPLMEGEGAYNDAKITSRDDVFDIEYDDRHDDDIHSLETLEEVGWRLFNEYNCDTNLEHLQEAANVAAKLTDNNRNDGIDVMRYLAESIGDRVDDVEFDYENLIVDQHTAYAGAVDQQGSALFKDEDGEWNHHLFDGETGEWRGSAVETDFYQEDPGHVASAQSSVGLFGYFDSAGAFTDNSDVVDWRGWSKVLNNYRFGNVRDSDTQVYFDPQTYSEDLPDVVRESSKEYVGLIRKLNEVTEKSNSGAVEFSYQQGSWDYQEVERDADRFQEMMEHRVS